MFNTQITELQSENQIEELCELSENELKAIVGGKILATGIKRLETQLVDLESQLEKLNPS